MKILVTALVFTLLCVTFSGCAVLEPLAKAIAQKTAVYLCTKAICKSDGNATP